MGKSAKVGTRPCAECQPWGKTPEQVLADFQAWVTKVRAALPDVRLVYLGQGPSPARWAQREKQQQANQLVRDYIAKGKNMASWTSGR